MNYERKKYELELIDLKDVSRCEQNKKRNDKMNLTKDMSFAQEKGNRLNMLDESITDFEKREEKENHIKSLEKDVSCCYTYIFI